MDIWYQFSFLKGLTNKNVVISYANCIKLIDRLLSEKLHSHIVTNNSYIYGAGLNVWYNRVWTVCEKVSRVYIIKCISSGSVSKKTVMKNCYFIFSTYFFRYNQPALLPVVPLWVHPTYIAAI